MVEASERRTVLSAVKTPLCVVVCTVAIAFVIARTAWLSDDGYITFRTVDNFIHGYGLTWNISERVQSYTHPLWMFFIAACYGVTREIFLTAIFASIAISLLTAGILMAGVARSTTLAIAGMLMLGSSRAFIDYSTSGLENPLSHLLLVIFVLLFLREKHTLSTLFWMAFVAALGMLNRMDGILLYAPALLIAFWAKRSWRALIVMALGFVPFGAWEIFSIIYYGFPFPNTAYAKLGTGIASKDLFIQGLYFFLHTIQTDLITFVVLVLGLAVPLLLRKIKLLALAAGVALYLLYIARIGGDFMGGRFFSAPFFACVMILTQLPAGKYPIFWLPAYAAIVLLSLLNPNAPFRTGADFGLSTAGFKDPHGVGDERRFYFHNSSLLQWKLNKRPMPSHHFAEAGRRYRAMNQELTKVHGAVGYRGFLAGPKLHIIDYFALNEPLLARLPSRYMPEWRIGHFYRFIPEGYETTVASGENQLRDPQLAEYYEHLKRIISGPIWSAQRWADIWNMNRGAYDHLIDYNRYRYPRQRETRLSALAAPKHEGTPWNAPGNITLSSYGAKIDLEGTQHAPRIEASFDNNDRYQLLFFKDDLLLDTVNVEPKRGRAGLAIQEIDVPSEVVNAGYSVIRIFPFPGDKYYSIGHLRLMN